MVHLHVVLWIVICCICLKVLWVKVRSDSMGALCESNIIGVSEQYTVYIGVRYQDIPPIVQDLPS